MEATINKNDINPIIEPIIDFEFLLNREFYINNNRFLLYEKEIKDLYNDLSLNYFKGIPNENDIKIIEKINKIIISLNMQTHIREKYVKTESIYEQKDIEIIKKQIKEQEEQEQSYEKKYKDYENKDVDKEYTEMQFNPMFPGNNNVFISEDNKWIRIIDGGISMDLRIEDEDIFDLLSSFGYI